MKTSYVQCPICDCSVDDAKAQTMFFTVEKHQGWWEVLDCSSVASICLDCMCRYDVQNKLIRFIDESFVRYQEHVNAQWLIKNGVVRAAECCHSCGCQDLDDGRDILSIDDSVGYLGFDSFRSVADGHYAFFCLDCSDKHAVTQRVSDELDEIIEQARSGRGCFGPDHSYYTSQA
ncbi:hypothetical protein [Alcanivorax sp. 1008]|uniref:hypothetical protein n=1 Tax=Alcanivorax sp. 1008 TaxID=2816853 RepID=UPI001D9E12B3|nr:hypothetical protein [Alcanivorax sp. 1008]MCC1497939.1 hypothetical protein [Alcanivorax sp. 1008]